MEIKLYPRAAPSDRIRVWVGIFQATSAPHLTWRLDNRAAVPVILREISSMRPDDMAPLGTAPENISGLSLEYMNSLVLMVEWTL